jgi:hypothetical protein
MLNNFLEDKNTDFEKKGVIDNKPFSKPEKKNYESRRDSRKDE